jgi:hypothetical protein
MNRIVRVLVFSTMATIAVAGCATKPKAPAATPDAEASSIQAESTGLSPTGEERFKTIDFALLFGNRESVSSWSVAVEDQGRKSAVFTLKGDGASIPDRFSWDGKSDSGKLADEGTYVATLSVAYEGKYNDARASSKPFILDITPPKGSFSPNPARFAYVPSAEASAITTRRVGFSPTSASVKNSLDLLLSAGSKAKLATWMVQVVGVVKGDATVVRTFSGGQSDLPDYLRWDGKDDSGKLVAEGSYYATFALGYGKAYKPTVVKSRNFSVVMTPPSGAITIDPPSIALSDLGAKHPVGLTVQAKSAFAQISSWIMAVYDPEGISVAVFNGNWPNNKVSWDGKTVEGGTLIPGSRYTVKAKVQDEYGNVGDLSGELAIEGLSGATEPSSIETLSSGFAPRGDGSASGMGFKIAVGDAASVSSWKVDIVDDRNIVEKTFSGSGKALPSSLRWDGKTAEGSYAPEGHYSAMLSLDYGVSFAPVTVETKGFILDLTPPSGAIGLSSDLFSPDGDGISDSETIALTGSSSLARIVGWSLTAYDPGKNPFMSWNGSWPASPIEASLWTAW